MTGGLEFTILILIFILLFIFFSGRKTIARLRRELRDASIAFKKKSKIATHLQIKYKDIIKIDVEVLKRKKLAIQYNKKILALKDDYQKKRGILDKLQNKISALEEDLEINSFGLYQPHYDFDTSEAYKMEMSKVRTTQKTLIKDAKAITCSTEWTLEGSKKEGAKMTKRNMKLMMRAFNNECDSAVLKVKWNNAAQLENRIIKSFEIINDLGEPNKIIIQNTYLKLKLAELRLTREYQEKLYEEKEEQKQIKAQMREEEKARREIETARNKAEKEEDQYQLALNKARADMEEAHGEEANKFEEKIRLLQEQLNEAHANKERAISRAQQTKCGHVYVISNVGSFGDQVYKIGMTRRLDPLDRVKELGDASVPFSFDIHALIFSENAPKLEADLHREFDHLRVNKINSRKEFFEISLKEIELKVTNLHGKIEFTQLAEAKEYRETISLKQPSDSPSEHSIQDLSELP